MHVWEMMRPTRSKDIQDQEYSVQLMPIVKERRDREEAKLLAVGIDRLIE